MNITYGHVTYKIIPESELIAQGLVRNPNMWMPNGGWHYCTFCRAYRYSKAYSTPGMTDCKAVCLDCNNHTEAVK